CANGVTSLDVW
nr:immunoglobulin heavy chain junction region [Macaca mulatta]MOV55971.1 immunoglobulin heavy chain junction region [Macaca mulatta]MOV57038.1 immunoglobulin heavy chain junction region [Macaca mulatta]MOV58210.1 immunoglobulin heavy chain junction region [Macaca mulatta]MOV58462.1 immunoglobulin heavy chain junction region [Macaca mulatta]